MQTEEDKGCFMKSKGLFKCIISMLLTAAIVTGTTFHDMPAAGGYTVHAAPQKVLTLKMARNLAKAESKDYEKMENQVQTKEEALSSAEKSVRLKKKSMSTFRWSPLINLKFPTTPDEATAYELQFKPVAAKYELDKARHALTDQVLTINEKVSNLYVEIVTLQRKIEFAESRVKTLEEGIGKNKARLATGDASQSDIDSMEKKLESLNNTLASNKSTLSADLKKLTGMIGTDATVYSFETPYLDGEIDRNALPAIIQYTKDRDETYYETCVNATTRRISLQTNYGLFRGHYGRDINMISGYVEQAINGDEFNTRGFRTAYKDFLKKIDSYWNGNFYIPIPLFFVIIIPKEWIKGDLDGIRYIDNDPEILLTDAMDYRDSLIEKEAAEKALEQSVTDSFENYISVRRSYLSYQKDVEKAKKDLEADQIKNRMGVLSYSEYSSALDEYEELQNSLIDTMSLYTTTINSFDRLTCGAITAYFSGTDASLQTAETGESYAEKSTGSGARFNIESLVQNQEFELTVYIPDEFPTEITHYELWIDNSMVGERTEKDKGLRHLGVAKDNVEEAKIRFYNNDEFVDDCVIDVQESSGPLNITTGYEIKKNEDGRIGSYTEETSETTGLSTVNMEMDEALEIKTYTVKTKDGQIVGKSEPVEIEKPFKHLAVVGSSLKDLRVEFYTGDGSLKATGRFDTANGVIIKVEEE